MTSASDDCEWSTDYTVTIVAGNKVVVHFYHMDQDCIRPINPKYLKKIEILARELVSIRAKKDKGESYDEARLGTVLAQIDALSVRLPRGSRVGG